MRPAMRVPLSTRPGVEPAPIIDVRRHPAQDVPAPLPNRILDPDHLGAERRQKLRCAGTGELTGEVADAQLRKSGGSQRPSFSR